MLKSYSPVPVNVTLCGNKGLADGQIKVRLLEWAQFQYDCIQCRPLDMKRERERDYRENAMWKLNHVATGKGMPMTAS